MSIPEPSFERVWPLIEVACLGTISDRQMHELQDSLRGDAELQRGYLEYCRMHAELRYLGRAHATNNAVLEKIASGTEADSPRRDGYEETPRQTALPPSPVLGFLGGAQGTAAYFSEHHVVFGYMVAVACFAVAALVGSLVNVSHNYNWITSRSATAPDFPPTREELVFVGRITGMKDCRWADPQTEAYAGASVPLNRRYALSSGLMEITYHSGVKVILEGPCAYLVESRAGGYLSLGMLTAKIEKDKSEVRGRKSEHYPLSTIHYPLSTICCPYSHRHRHRLGHRVRRRGRRERTIKGTGIRRHRADDQNSSRRRVRRRSDNYDRPERNCRIQQGDDQRRQRSLDHVRPRYARIDS